MPKIKVDKMECELRLNDSYVPTDNDLVFVSSWCEYLNQKLSAPEERITECDVISIYNLFGIIIDKIIQEQPLIDIGICFTPKQNKYSKYLGEWILEKCIEPKKFEYVTGFEDIVFLYYRLTALKHNIEILMKNK